MPHPQRQELEDAIAKFLRDSTRSLEVVLPDPSASADLLARKIRATVSFVHLDHPSMRINLGSAEREALARRLGFEIKTRTAYHPARGEMKISYAQRPVRDAADGANSCLQWLEQVASLGGSWLWITELEYDSWPTPLPKPPVWPPAG